MAQIAAPRPVIWLGSSRADLKRCPQQVRRETDPAAKPLKGFGGARVMEIVERYDTNTYRAVYTAQFDEALYVLHVF
ncbi:MAG: type II toxin-antitoxin system RelE/ParE family toxin, partial [Gemmatimonadaceae bacterium]